MNNLFYAAIVSILCILSESKYLASSSSCGQCQQSNNVICYDQHLFSLCINGVPTSSNITCPYGTVCTNHMLVCLNSESLSSTNQASCEATNELPPSNCCGICASQGQVFSCIDEITIAFCYGRNEPNMTALATCPPYTVCDLSNSKDFCTLQNITGASCRLGEQKITTPKIITTTPKIEITTEEETTSTNEVTTTPKLETTTPKIITTTPKIEITTQEETTYTNEVTTITPKLETTTEHPTTTTEECTTTEASTTGQAQLNLQVYCGNQIKPGFYANVNDPTCESFIYCVRQNNIWIGSVVYCEDAFPYFDRSINECISIKPQECL